MYLFHHASQLPDHTSISLPQDAGSQILHWRMKQGEHIESPTTTSKALCCLLRCLTTNHSSAPTWLQTNIQQHLGRLPALTINSKANEPRVSPQPKGGSPGAQTHTPVMAAALALILMTIAWQEALWQDSLPCPTSHKSRQQGCTVAGTSIKSGVEAFLQQPRREIWALKGELRCRLRGKMHYLILVFINIWASTVDKQTRISLPVHILKRTVYTWSSKGCPHFINNLIRWLHQKKKVQFKAPERGITPGYWCLNSGGQRLNKRVSKIQQIVFSTHQTATVPTADFQKFAYQQVILNTQYFKAP